MQVERAYACLVAVRGVETRPIAYVQFANTDLEDGLFNACLIAAAPELYEALRAAVDAAQPLPAPLGPPLTEHVDVWPDWVIAARAALAKVAP